MHLTCQQWRKSSKFNYPKGLCVNLHILVSFEAASLKISRTYLLTKKLRTEYQFKKKIKTIKYVTLYMSPLKKRLTWIGSYL